MTKCTAQGRNNLAEERNRITKEAAYVGRLRTLMDFYEHRDEEKFKYYEKEFINLTVAALDVMAESEPNSDKE